LQKVAFGFPLHLSAMKGFGCPIPFPPPSPIHMQFRKAEMLQLPLRLHLTMLILAIKKSFEIHKLVFKPRLKCCAKLTYSIKSWPKDYNLYSILLIHSILLISPAPLNSCSDVRDSVIESWRWTNKFVCHRIMALDK